MYNTKLLNDFYTLLFYSYTNSCSSITENTKTDCLFKFDCFEDWFDNLINTFIEELSYNVTKEDVLKDLKDLKDCPKFIKDMKTEYVELQDLCKDE